MSGKEKAKAKESRRAETEKLSPSATTGAKATATAGMPRRAISPTIAHKEAKAIKRAKKEIMSMVVEAMAEKEDDGKSAARSASEALLDLCRGVKKKSVGMIGLNLLSPDFAPSLPKPTSKSIMMLPRRGMSAQEFRPVDRARARAMRRKQRREMMAKK